ncbi:MAG: hypothetical protein WC087_02990 [Candidatus Paceibacterota bacterium]
MKIVRKIRYIWSFFCWGLKGPFSFNEYVYLMGKGSQRKENAKIMRERWLKKMPKEEDFGL